MEENTQIEVLRKHCMYYDVPIGDTPDECVRNLSNTPRFREEFAKTRDVEMTLKRMETDRLTGQEVTAFFLKNGFEKKNNDTGNWEATEGIQVLMPNGRTYRLEGRELPDAKPIETRVTLSPVTITRNVITGDMKISTPRDVTYQVGGDTNAPIPDVDLSYPIKKAFSTNKSGVIWGSSGDNPVLATLTIGTEPGDVSYFGESDYGPASLTVRAFDSNGLGVQIKFDNERLAELQQLFYIDPDADREEYEAALGGEPIVVNGHIGVTFPMEPARFGATPEEGEQKFQETLEFLENMGLLGAYESNGERLQFLDLSRAAADEDGNRPDHVEIDGKRCMDIRQERDKQTKAIVWKAAVHHEDVGKLPWMSVKTSVWYTKEGEERHWNPGAFFVFPTRAGAVTSNAGGVNTGIYAGLNTQVSLGDFSDAAPTDASEEAAEAGTGSFNLTNKPAVE